jgi:hypothetical protein
MFRGSELFRLLSMVAFLGVLGMFMFRASDPAMWSWLDRQSDSTETAATTAAKPAAKPDAAKPQTETVATGPTDEDPDQKDDVAEEFQAVTDGTVGIQPEEMFAYWRLFFWTDHQTFDAMRGRAQGNVSFTQFIHAPEKYRGRLVRMDLNVRRVLTYEVDDSPVGVKRIYEIWGFSDDSKAWLYDVVTAQVPEGMPIGPSVSERVKFVGYFFKLQGYHEAGAKPRDPVLRAPLLVGRIMRYPSPQTQPRSEGAGWWACGLLGGAAVLIIGYIGLQRAIGRRAERHRAARQEQTSDSVRQWLRQDFVDGAEPPADETDDTPGLDGYADPPRE